jgi:hypothetical protein
MNKNKIPLLLKAANVDFVTEYKFHPFRKWRFDFAIPDKLVAVEYNGVFSNKSRHITAVGHTGDCEKLNQAQILGWRVLQYTPLSKEADILNDLKALTNE